MILNILRYLTSIIDLGCTVDNPCCFEVKSILICSSINCDDVKYQCLNPTVESSLSFRCFSVLRLNSISSELISRFISVLCVQATLVRLQVYRYKQELHVGLQLALPQFFQFQSVCQHILSYRYIQVFLQLLALKSFCIFIEAHELPLQLHKVLSFTLKYT